MLWAFVAAAIVGVAIGLRFRVPLLLVSAILISVATLAFAVYSGWPVVSTITAIFGLLAVQQVSYLIGLVASSHLAPTRDGRTNPPTTKVDACSRPFSDKH